MPTPPAPPRILAVRFSSIGDILLTTPLLRALRRRHPGAYLAVLTKAAYRPLLADNPHLNAVETLAAGGSLRHTARSIRAARYSHLLDLHGSVRSHLLRRLAPGNWSGYPKHRLARTLLIRWKTNRYPPGTPPVAERYFAAARDLGPIPDGGPPELFLNPAARAAVAAWLTGAALGRRPLAALAPGAAHATKRWPVEAWLELTRRLTATGWDVVVVGGPDDRPAAEAVAAAAGAHGRSAAGAFDLQETGALLERAQGLVSGDTGVMHMATALGTPVTALFGPTVAAFGFAPYRAAAQVIERDLPCRPCSTMGGPRCPLGHHRCLRDISPETVLGAFLRLARPA